MAEDYAALRQEHTQLMASEARYKALASQLENKVHEQVVELQARQERLFRAARLASVGQLAAGVAHEINNPLGFMRSNLSTLANYLHSFAALKNQPELSSEVWQSLSEPGGKSASRPVPGKCGHYPPDRHSVSLQGHAWPPQSGLSQRDAQRASGH